MAHLKLHALGSAEDHDLSALAAGMLTVQDGGAGKSLATLPLGSGLTVACAGDEPAAGDFAAWPDGARGIATCASSGLAFFAWKAGTEVYVVEASRLAAAAPAWGAPGAWTGVPDAGTADWASFQADASVAPAADPATGTWSVPAALMRSKPFTLTVHPTVSGGQEPMTGDYRVVCGILNAGDPTNEKYWLRRLGLEYSVNGGPWQPYADAAPTPSADDPSKYEDHGGVYGANKQGVSVSFRRRADAEPFSTLNPYDPGFDPNNMPWNLAEANSMAYGRCFQLYARIDPNGAIADCEVSGNLASLFYHDFAAASCNYGGSQAPFFALLHGVAGGLRSLAGLVVPTSGNSPATTQYIFGSGSVSGVTVGPTFVIDDAATVNPLPSDTLRFISNLSELTIIAPLATSYSLGGDYGPLRYTGPGVIHTLATTELTDVTTGWTQAKDAVAS